jgi:type IX secretion system PorP/SprF family membrane protein
MFNAGIQYRTQWAGLDNNPTTVNFSSNMSVYRNKAGVGLLVTQDKVGDSKNTEVNGVFAYRINLNKTSVSFGMQTGFIRYENDLSKLSIRDPGDPAFTQTTETKFNTGFGVLLKSDRFIAGLSVPRMLPATVSQGGQEIELYQQHYYLFGSYVFFLSEQVRFKPAVLFRGTKSAPVSTDLNMLFTYKEYYTAGLFTRNFKTYGMIAQVMAGKFRFGYVFELPGNGETSLNYSSHELMIGMSMDLLPFHDRAVKTF